VSEVSIQDLLESGVHFGHQTRRWNPKMKKFIFTERNNIYIIDLKKTQQLLKEACDAVREITAKGGAILFVGTKPQAAQIIKSEAQRCNQYYVNNRWLGGMLTNFRTIRQSVKRLDHLEKMAGDGTYEHLTKKEILTHEKHRGRLLSVLDGIREMNRIPGLVVVVDTRKEKIAVSEAKRLGIPVCAVLDTNSDPDPITYPIPGNDDAIRSIQLLLSHITESILEGLQLRVDEGIVTEKEETEETGREKEIRPRRRRPPRAGKAAAAPEPEKVVEAEPDEDIDIEDEEESFAEAKKEAKKTPWKKPKQSDDVDEIPKEKIRPKSNKPPRKPSPEEAVGVMKAPVKEKKSRTKKEDK